MLESVQVLTLFTCLLGMFFQLRKQLSPLSQQTSSLDLPVFRRFLLLIQRFMRLNITHLHHHLSNNNTVHEKLEQAK